MASVLHMKLSTRNPHLFVFQILKCNTFELNLLSLCHPQIIACLPAISPSLGTNLLISYLSGKNHFPHGHPLESQRLAFSTSLCLLSIFSQISSPVESASLTSPETTHPLLHLPFPFLVGITLHVLHFIPNPLICLYVATESSLHNQI